MDVKNLKTFEGGDTFETDLLIIGGGAAGLSIAREFIGTGHRVIVAESGDQGETAEHERLNEVDLASSTVPQTWIDRRATYHGHQAHLWSGDVQRFGVRCRGLGGSTAAWAGKSAIFSPQDYAYRDWMPNSGWPIDGATMAPFIRRAEQHLNLGVGSYGDDFWERYTGKHGKPNLDPADYRSFFWQFARSRINPMQMLRMGPEFVLEKSADNIRVLVNATAMSITPSEAPGGTALVELSSLEGVKASVKTRLVVVACGALENARLLLASQTVSPTGLGNERDQVGRYLIDHLNAPIASFAEAHTQQITEQFGFFGLISQDRVDMYSHGLELSAEAQKRDGLVNGAAYSMAERAEDDPWGALGDLLRGRSKNIPRDIVSVVKSPKLMFTGAGRIFLQSEKVPKGVRNAVVNTLVRVMPNFVVEEYQTQGVPHKLVSVGFDAIVEQEPLKENRVVLSENRNPIGQQLPLVQWEPGERSLRTLMRMGEIMAESFPKAGLPAPTPAEWIRNKSIADAPIVDTAHTSGTTRMSLDPNKGVVDANCKVHGVENVYIAGASVFPTSGHTNPTLMIVSLALRLSDHLKATLSDDAGARVSADRMEPSATEPG